MCTRQSCAAAYVGRSNVSARISGSKLRVLFRLRVLYNHVSINDKAFMEDMSICEKELLHVRVST